MANNRTVIHVDMDAFYASVEQHDNPELAGKPVIVGGTGPRGVVAAASYEVRQFGVRSAMPVREALRRCPAAICIRPRMRRYQEVSRQIFEIFRSFTPLVEGLSLDEAFLDVTASLKLHGSPAELGRKLKTTIRTATGLTASVGIGTNKLLAKIASDLEKPDGLCHIEPHRVHEILDPLPVGALSGVGPQTRKALHRAGIYTLEDLRMAPEGLLQPVFGRFAARTKEKAAGIDHRPVSPLSADKSISAEETFDTDIGDRVLLKKELLGLTERTATRVRRKNLLVGCVSLKIRRSDFTTFTRQRRFQPPTNETAKLFGIAVKLLEQWLDQNSGVELRLLGVGMSQFSEAEQMDLFAPANAANPVDTTVDRIRARFGAGAIQRGRGVKADRTPD